MANPCQQSRFGAILNGLDGVNSEAQQNTKTAPRRCVNTVDPRGLTHPVRPNRTEGSMKPIPYPLAVSLMPRILKNVTVHPVTGCWITGNRAKYASLSVVTDGATEHYMVHRITYVFLNRFIGDGMDVDHLCQNPPCCNPTHLREATRADNVLRSLKNPAAINARKTTCARGHEFTDFSSTRKNRQCVICRVEKRAERRATRRAMGVPVGEAHGTSKSYGFWSCRCDECKAWQRADYIAKKSQRPEDVA